MLVSMQLLPVLIFCLLHRGKTLPALPGHLALLVSLMTKQEGQRNDHVGDDVVDIGLSEQQLRTIDEVYLSKRIQSEEFRRTAASSGWKHNRHQVYRYFAASQWADRYNGKRIEDAVVDTVTWRRDFGIRNIDLKRISPIIERGVAYVNGLDRHGRVIIYFKFGRIGLHEDPETLLKALMHTVEKADVLSEVSLSGEFIAVIDFDGVSLGNMPPFKVIHTAIDLLKLHYPYRLGGVFVMNTGFTFTMIWRMIRPLLPKLALSKTHIVSKRDRKRILFASIGEDFLESSYGGKVTPVTKASEYFQR